MIPSYRFLSIPLRQSVNGLLSDSAFSSPTQVPHRRWSHAANRRRKSKRLSRAKPPKSRKEDVIRAVTDFASREFERLGLVFHSLWGRPLQLIDCQNLF